MARKKNIDGTDRIIVICYNRIEYWHSRKNAMDFFMECMLGCEGCEKERYTNIYCDLARGAILAHDGMSGTYAELIKNGWELNITSPDKTRDYGGKIWYPKW